MHLKPRRFFLLCIGCWTLIVSATKLHAIERDVSDARGTQSDANPELEAPQRQLKRMLEATQSDAQSNGPSENTGGAVDAIPNLPRIPEHGNVASAGRGLQAQRQILHVLETTERDTILRQQAALQASLHEQQLLEAHEKQLEEKLKQLEHAKQPSSELESTSSRADSKAFLHPPAKPHSLGRHEFIPTHTLNEEKMTGTQKMRLFILFGVALAGLLLCTYHMSKNLSKRLATYVNPANEARAWLTAQKRAKVLFSWWPMFEPTSGRLVRDLPHPVPPPFPTSKPQLKYLGINCNCFRRQYEYFHPPVEAEHTAKDPNIWVQIFHERIYDCEKMFLRAYQFKERADAWFFMQLVSATLVMVLVPIEGTFQSEFIDILLKITMMTLAIVGTLVKGMEMAFDAKGQGDSWLICAETESELIYDLANLSDEFQVTSDHPDKISINVFLDKYQLYLDMSAHNRDKIFEERKTTHKDAKRVAAKSNTQNLQHS